MPPQSTIEVLLGEERLVTAFVVEKA
jgi:hypothetical protein